jgi:hypothetical protein
MPEKHNNRRALIFGLGLSLALFVGGLLALPTAQPQRQQARPATIAPLKKSAPKVMCHKTDPAAQQQPISN